MNITDPVIGFQPYDLAIRDLFTVDLYADPVNKQVKETIIPVFGTPRREYGTQENLEPFIIEDPDTRLNQTIKLPASSVFRTNWSLDNMRWHQSSYRRLGLTEEGNKVIQSERLVPVDIQYQLSLWTKYRSQMNQFMRQIILKFTQKEARLDISLGGPWDVWSIPLWWSGGPFDLTDIDPGEHDRTIRVDFDFLLQGYIVPDPIEIPTVKYVDMDMWIGKQVAPWPQGVQPWTDWEFVRNIETYIQDIDEVDMNP